MLQHNNNKNTTVKNNQNKTSKLQKKKKKKQKEYYQQNNEMKCTNTFVSLPSSSWRRLLCRPRPRHHLLFDSKSCEEKQRSSGKRSQLDRSKHSHVDKML
jgi:hypothetical protein